MAWANLFSSSIQKSAYFAKFNDDSFAYRVVTIKSCIYNLKKYEFHFFTTNFKTYVFCCTNYVDCLC